MDSKAVSDEERRYKKIPIINRFLDENGNDIMKQQIQLNYDKIKAEVLQIVEEEMGRIENNLS